MHCYNFTLIFQYSALDYSTNIKLIYYRNHTTLWKFTLANNNYKCVYKTKWQYALTFWQFFFISGNHFFHFQQIFFNNYCFFIFLCFEKGICEIYTIQNNYNTTTIKTKVWIKYISSEWKMKVYSGNILQLYLKFFLKNIVFTYV